MDDRDFEFYVDTQESKPSNQFFSERVIYREYIENFTLTFKLEYLITV